MKGELINVDGHGNRVSAMIFGPKQVIIVAGYNKIVEDEQSAIQRIRTIAAPANCMRLNKKTPCRFTGSCTQCYSEDRICSSYVKINYDKEDRLRVILVKENLGIKKGQSPFFNPVQVQLQQYPLLHPSKSLQYHLLKYLQ